MCVHACASPTGATVSDTDGMQRKSLADVDESFLLFFFFCQPQRQATHTHTHTQSPSTQQSALDTPKALFEYGWVVVWRGLALHWAVQVARGAPLVGIFVFFGFLGFSCRRRRRVGARQQIDWQRARQHGHSHYHRPHSHCQGAAADRPCVQVRCRRVQSIRCVLERCASAWTK